MPRYCPECRGEFRDEIVSCPDCEVVLVAEWALKKSPEEQARRVLEQLEIEE